MKHLRVCGAQVDVRVGDIGGNMAKILDAMAWAERQACDVLLLPELAVTGYPPEDLVLRDGFIMANLEALDKLASATGETPVVVGFVDRIDEERTRTEDAVVRAVANAAAVLHRGAIKGVYHKVLLPNYGVFDEARYFAPGRDGSVLWEIAGTAVGVSICEDIWSPTGPPCEQVAAGASVLLNINGSPYHMGKTVERAELLRGEAVRAATPVVYLNMVGGQDELVFDGDSMAFDATGELLYRAAQFEEELFVVDVPLPDRNALGEGRTDTTARVRNVTTVPDADRPAIANPPPVPRLSEEAEVYTALVTGLRDYVRNNGFPGVVIGLSGGIDSALTATIAVDALGADAVWGVTMPTRYSSEGSVSDSRELATRLGCRFDVIPIDDIFSAHLAALEQSFAGSDEGVAEENLQARIRGAVVMALSNKFGWMVVAAGNKSEMAVGYATLYGDMAGGFAVLKDVFKTLEYRLAEWRNSEGAVAEGAKATGSVIPQSIIDKAPSAELRPDQKDTDSLPEYDILDQILFRYVELDESAAEIVSAGFDRDVVERVARMVDRNEYKRRQAAPGVKISKKAFGKDRRLPITQHFPP